MVLFEDEEDDLLSKLYRSAYTEEISSKFVYSGGNGNLKNKAIQILNSNSDRLFILLDSVPGNSDIIDIYEDLQRLCNEYKNRVVVFNIVCAEYYFIKANLANYIFKSKEGLDIICNSDVFTKSKLISSKDDKKFCTTFEKYCKLVLLKDTYDCARHSRGCVENNNVNPLYSYYYTKNCLNGTGTVCTGYYDFCSNLELKVKGVDFVKAYPCRPYGLSNDKRMSDEEIVVMHRKLVDEFNERIRKYNSYYISIGDRKRVVNPVRYSL